MAKVPHVLVIPYPSKGHVIPLLELSHLLTNQGIKVTFVCTDNIDIAVDNDQINLISFPDSMQSSAVVLQVLPGKVEELIQQMNASECDRISCVLSDQSIGWALELAEKMGIQRAAFCPAAAAQLVLGFSIPKLIEDGVIDSDGSPTKEQVINLAPNMPAMSTSHFVWTCLPNKESRRTIFALMVKNNKAIMLTEWLLCNSTYNLEPEAFRLHPEILPIGPVSSSNNRLGGNQTESTAKNTCIDWLDKQQPQSVIYIAFGTHTALEQTQLQELASGLERISVARPFMWVVPKSNASLSSEMLMKEFQEKVGENGMIVKWAPQKKVLAHPSIACFVSHCGWNSVMEGVSNGVPFLCWPYFADQFFNKSYVCDVWRIGLGLEKNENGMVTYVELKSKLEQVLTNVEFRSRALVLKELVLNSTKEGGSSYQNLTNYVEWLKA